MLGSKLQSQSWVAFEERQRDASRQTEMIRVYILLQLQPILQRPLTIYNKLCEFPFAQTTKTDVKIINIFLRKFTKKSLLKPKKIGN